MIFPTLSPLQAHCGILLILIVILALPFGTLLQHDIPYHEQKAAAQWEGSTPSGMSEYENKTYGIKIPYAITWKVVDNLTNPKIRNINIVKFDSHSSVPYSENLVVSIDYPNQNETLGTYVAEKIEAYRLDKAFEKDFFTPISVDTTGHLLGLPAYDIFYTWFDPSHHVLYGHECGTIIDHHVYYYTYSAEVSRYPVYLPIIQRMIDSLQIDIPGINATQIANESVPEI
jgi:hypothetical protein